jgi:DNA-directed RNA polymerase subunit RPC12/RpoP
MWHKYSDCSCGGKMEISTSDIDEAQKSGKTYAFCEKCQSKILVTKEQINKWRHDIFIGMDK